MNPEPGSRNLEPAVALSLCRRCVHARRVTSSKGSVFILCALSASDPRFPKYPPLPVIRCDGFAPLPTAT
jgi:hypothetical protein